MHQHEMSGGTGGLNGAAINSAAHGVNGTDTNGHFNGTSTNGDQDDNGAQFESILVSNGDHTHQESSKPLVEPIAICGMGMRLPGGIRDAEGFWDLLYNQYVLECSLFTAFSLYVPERLSSSP